MRDFERVRLAAFVAIFCFSSLAACAPESAPVERSLPPLRPATHDRRCPIPLNGGRFGAAHAADATRRQLKRIFPGFDRRDSRISASISLGMGDFVPKLSSHYYTARPAEACGRHVVQNSWVVIVSLPRAPMASLVPALVYVARTPTGWHAWYVGFPNYGGWGFVDS